MTLAQEPLVSVILPVYNAEEFLHQAISSVLAQTYTHFELLIVDDGSTDGSGDIIRSFRDGRIRFIRNEKNLKLIATLNKATQLCTGKYIARMDADDISSPDRLRRQVTLMEQNEHIGVCSTWAYWINTEGKHVGTLKTPGGARLNKLFWRPSPIVHAACMVRSFILKNNPYDSYYEDAEDYELWLRLFSRNVGFRNIAEPLYSIRLHGESVTQKRRDNQLRKSYDAFQAYIGVPAVDYDAFLALLYENKRMNPARRFYYSWQIARKMGFDAGSFAKDNLFYVLVWLKKCVS